jgi:chaperonin cofactor prefoldin
MEEGGPNSNVNGNEAMEDMKAHISSLEKEVTFLKDKYEQLEKRLEKMESQPPLL